MKLQNKVAVVTGAASGIGKEIALLYASEGAKVVIADLNLDQAEQVVSEIKAKGGEAMAVAMDVTNEDQVNKGIEDAVKKFGNIHVLVSNAGIQIIESVDKLSLANWKKCWQSIWMAPF